jgi:hypothetical protein
MIRKGWKLQGSQSGCEMYYLLYVSIVGLFLLIPQVTKKEREPSLPSIMREIWDFSNKNIPWCEDWEVSIFLVQAFNVGNGV